MIKNPAHLAALSESIESKLQLIYEDEKEWAASGKY